MIGPIESLDSVGMGLFNDYSVCMDVSCYRGS